MKCKGLKRLLINVNKKKYIEQIKYTCCIEEIFHFYYLFFANKKIQLEKKCSETIFFGQSNRI
jgi:hypothetical protein